MVFFVPQISWKTRILQVERGAVTGFRKGEQKEEGIFTVCQYRRIGKIDKPHNREWERDTKTERQRETETETEIYIYRERENERDTEGNREIKETKKG